MSNWLQSLTESYKQISIQKELETLIEHIHKENPNLNESEIKELILNELKMPSPEQLDKEAERAYGRATWGKGMLSRVKEFLGQFRLTNPPKGHPTADTQYYALRGTKPGDLDVKATSQETRDSLRKLREMPPGDASGVVADLARGDRAQALAQRLRNRQLTGKSVVSDVKDITKIEKQARARQQMGIPPQGTTTGGDVTKPLVQDKQPATTSEAPKTRKPRQPRKSK